jgi:hypothetical protein
MTTFPEPPAWAAFVTAEGKPDIMLLTQAAVDQAKRANVTTEEAYARVVTQTHGAVTVVGYYETKVEAGRKALKAAEKAAK